MNLSMLILIGDFRERGERVHADYADESTSYKLYLIFYNYFLCNSSKKVTKKSRRRTSNDAKPSRNCFSGKPRCSFLCGCDRARRKQLFSFEALLAFVKLLTSFVNRGALFFVAATELGEAKQYLRSSLSYGFFFRRCCNAGKIYSHPPPKQAKIFRCPSGRKASKER